MSKSLEKFIQTNKYYLECECEGEGVEGVVSLRRHLAKTVWSTKRIRPKWKMAAPW